MSKFPKLHRPLVLGVIAILVPLATMTAPAATAEQQAQPAALKPVHADADIPLAELGEYETEIEARLLGLANLARAESGAPPLTLDSGLSQAARMHAQAMLDAHQLSHRFEGELSVPQRLAAKTHLQLDQEAENVALDFSADGGHEHLMLSPPHRANLLNPTYNVVGLGVVRSGNRLYIVQDFGHALASYSLGEFQERIAAAVNQMRRQANRPELRQLEIPDADDAACSMARSDKLGTAAVYHLAERYTVLTFTTLRPEALPADATRAITGPNLRGVSIGVCYARTDTYPTGMYWVVLSLD